MRSPATAIEYRRLRVPREDRGVLIEPPPDELGAVVDRNLRDRAAADCDVQGRDLAALRRQARRELLVEAARWVAGYSDVGPSFPQRSADGAEGLIFLAGHQPGLFHPGVWAKNFALSALARRHGAVAVNLVIDGDTARDTSVRVPGGSPSEPTFETLAMDRLEPQIPHELRSIVDRPMFADFGRRAARQIAPLVGDPLIETYWPMVRERMRQTDNLGACLAQARHRLEAAWGLRTLEVPQSRLCQAEPFCWFVAHLLAQLPRLWAIYNDALAEYRRVHRTRSATHPAPNLGREGEWLETPLWIFSADDPRRRGLWARRRGDRIVLGDRGRIELDVPLRPEGDAARAVARLMELPAEGIHVRSRALITTLWARLVLGDLFLHGIGGAKYDQVTDALIERFFGLSPPGFLVVSATLHLPIRRPSDCPDFRLSENGTVPLDAGTAPMSTQTATAQPPEVIAAELRRLVYHPERYIDASAGAAAEGAGGAAALIAEKADWVRTSPTAAGAKRRCQAIRRINRALQPWVEPRRQRLLALRERAARARRSDDVLRWREYAFCLYPEETIRGFFRRLLPNDA